MTVWHQTANKHNNKLSALAGQVADKKRPFKLHYSWKRM